MVSFTITLGRKHWYVVGEYVPPNNQPAVQRVKKALSRGLAGVETMLVGDLNA